MRKAYASSVSRSIHEGVSDLYTIGLVDKATMREFDRSCLTARIEPDQVKGLREREHASQAVLAEHLGVSVSTVSQWERGRRKPDGPALKLLGLAMANGLAYIR